MRITFICPYFGQLPNYFEYVLKSMEYSKEIEWLIITDDVRCFNYPENVKVINMKFEEFKGLIQKKFDFKITLETPYKLCDYKPIYGYVLNEYIKESDYWGHCDLDCIFGDIIKFVKEAVDNKIDKIGYLGHMTLYRNDKEINSRFKIKVGNYDYKKVFTSNEIYVFDEAFDKLSMNVIYEKNKFSSYKKAIFADISCLYNDFRLYRYDEKLKYKLEHISNQIFLWREGKVYSINKNKKEEFGYVHFQKRKVEIEDEKLLECKSFVLMPNKLTSRYELDKITKISYRKYFYKPYLEQKIKALKIKIRRSL